MRVNRPPGGRSTMMLNRADECWRRADECRRNAAQVADDVLRGTYLDLARRWRMMAHQAGSREQKEGTKKRGVPDTFACHRACCHRGLYSDLRTGFGSSVLGRSPVGRLGRSSVGRLGLGRLGRSPSPTNAKRFFFAVLWRPLQSSGTSGRFLQGAAAAQTGDAADQHGHGDW